MSSNTHYDTLSLARGAPQSLIKAVYKTLALEYHPDKTVGMPESQRDKHTAMFRAVKEAYDVLGDPAKKTAYDRTLSPSGTNCQPSTSQPQPDSTGFAGPTRPAPYGRPPTNPPPHKSSFKRGICKKCGHIHAFLAHYETCTGRPAKPPSPPPSPELPRPTPPSSPPSSNADTEDEYLPHDYLYFEVRSRMAWERGPMSEFYRQNYKQEFCRICRRVHGSLDPCLG